MSAWLNKRDVESLLVVTEPEASGRSKLCLIVTTDHRIVLTRAANLMVLASWDLAVSLPEVEFENGGSVRLGGRDFVPKWAANAFLESWSAAAHRPYVSPRVDEHQQQLDEHQLELEGRVREGELVIGSNGRVRVLGDLIEITRELSDDMVFGNLRGTKSIPIRAVQAVQFKRATAWVGGAIEFVVAGDRSNTGHDSVRTGHSALDMIVGRRLSRMGNENTVTFALNQQPPFIALHKHVLSLIANGPSHAPGAIVEPRADLVTELKELAQLRNDGVLTDDEFGEAKSRLLAR